MKKVYLPNDNVLSEMQSMGVNINQYVEIKMAESIITDGKNYPAKGILKNCYQYVKENPDIVHAICLLYPEEIKHSELAQFDNGLLRQLINKDGNKSIYNLDHISKFTTSTQNNSFVIKDTINKLAKELPNNPEYRFEYKDNSVLNDIFSCKLETNLYFYLTLDIVRDLLSIEPAYYYMLKNKKIKGYGEILDQESIAYLLESGLDSYTDRYGLDYIPTYEIKPETKRLIKAIRRNKDIMY